MLGQPPIALLILFQLGCKIDRKIQWRVRGKQMTKPEIRSTFKRTNYFHIKSDGVDLGRAIIRVNRHVINKDAERAVFNNQLIKVERADGLNRPKDGIAKIKGAQGVAYGILKYHPNVEKDEIALSNEMTDYLLMENTKEPIELVITPAARKELKFFLAQHPDPALRMAEHLSARRLWIGIILGFFLGIAGSYSVRVLDFGFETVPNLIGALLG